MGVDRNGYFWSSELHNDDHDEGEGKIWQHVEHAPSYFLRFNFKTFDSSIIPIPTPYTIIDPM
jgi:hypothetical protein